MTTKSKNKLPWENIIYSVAGLFNAASRFLDARSNILEIQGAELLAAQKFVQDSIAKSKQQERKVEIAETGGSDEGVEPDFAELFADKQ